MVPSRRFVDVTSAGESRCAANIRTPASCGRPKYCETAICVHGRGHCVPPDGRCGSSSGPGCESTGPAVRSTPADRRSESKKNFCCVTTRRRNLTAVRRLGRGLRPAAVRALSCGVLGFDLGGLTAAGLSARRLPAADFALAFRILAVALVPAPRLIPVPAAFAETEPRARPSHTGTALVF